MKQGRPPSLCFTFISLHVAAIPEYLFPLTFDERQEAIFLTIHCSSRGVPDTSNARLKFFSYELRRVIFFFVLPDLQFHSGFPKIVQELLFLDLSERRKFHTPPPLFTPRLFARSSKGPLSPGSFIVNDFGILLSWPPFCFPLFLILRSFYNPTGRRFRLCLDFSLIAFPLPHPGDSIACFLNLLSERRIGRLFPFPYCLPPSYSDLLALPGGVQPSREFFFLRFSSPIPLVLRFP